MADLCEPGRRVAEFAVDPLPRYDGARIVFDDRSELAEPLLRQLEGRLQRVHTASRKGLSVDCTNVALGDVAVGNKTRTRCGLGERGRAGDECERRCREPQPGAAAHHPLNKLSFKTTCHRSLHGSSVSEWPGQNSVRLESRHPEQEIVSPYYRRAV